MRKALMGLAVAAMLAAGAPAIAGAADAPAWRTVKVMQDEDGNPSVLAVDVSSVRLDGGMGHADVALMLNSAVGEGPPARFGIAMSVDYDCAKRSMRISRGGVITEDAVDMRDMGDDIWDVPPAGSPMDQVGLMACGRQPVVSGPSYASPQALRAAWMTAGGGLQ